jgi:hypothetical protein
MRMLTSHLYLDFSSLRLEGQGAIEVGLLCMCEIS